MIYDQKENLYRSVRFTGEPSNEFACDLAPFLRFQTLEAAIQHRDWLESEAGKQERIQREERRQARIAYDLAREERKRLESAVKQTTRTEFSPEYWDESETEVFV